MKSLKMFMGAAVLAVSSYMMIVSGQAAAADQVGPLVLACDRTKNCYTKQTDCSQGGKFMQCQCDTKKDACYINNKSGG